MVDRQSPKSSICVPTFNRAACLGECLTSILASAEKHQDEIEVVISDNASSNDTPKVVAEFQSQYLWTQYCRNDTNIGEPNFYLAASRAKGE